MRAIPDDNLSYPVLIKHSKGSGSGFLLSAENGIQLITAKHVLLDDKGQPYSDVIDLVVYGRNASIDEPAIFKADLSVLPVASHGTQDVVMVRIGDFKDKETNEVRSLTGLKLVSRPDGFELGGVVVSYFKEFKDVLVANDVYVFGYPNSLGYPGQIDYDRPLLRKGIVAGKNLANRTIIVDCPIYYGNSGGLVIEVEQLDLGTRQFHAIGVISQFIPFIEEKVSVQHKGIIHKSVENSGYGIAISIDCINELMQEYSSENLVSEEVSS